MAEVFTVSTKSKKQKCACPLNPLQPLPGTDESPNDFGKNH
ncbi:TPA: hypothetical protein ACM7CE_004871 [Escherichia coli]|uniref:Uncharacterized protein n=1 Tax=Escherichia coli TaxID=562 RepID=A0A220SXF3_ECOLX|nr:hypothetical protein [Escherichia coli]ASK38408.1 hypothetical protein [Escherichia coli]QQZ47264.1 hypothetical protein [Escherichia coli]